MEYRFQTHLAPDTARFPFRCTHWAWLYCYVWLALLFQVRISPFLEQNTCYMSERESLRQPDNVTSLQLCRQFVGPADNNAAEVWKSAGERGPGGSPINSGLKKCCLKEITLKLTNPNKTLLLMMESICSRFLLLSLHDMKLQMFTCARDFILIRTTGLACKPARTLLGSVPQT